jgi:hypothetical protein
MLFELRHRGDERTPEYAFVEPFSSQPRRRPSRSALAGLAATLLWIDGVTIAVARAVWGAFVEGVIAYAHGWYGLPPDMDHRFDLHGEERRISHDRDIPVRGRRT